MTYKRNHSVDLIKAIASFFVTAVHFRNRVEPLILEEFYTHRMKVFFTLNYSIFIIAVPLFLITTGFLNTHIKLNKKYFTGILKIYFLYFFIALISYPLMVFFGVRENIGILRMIKRTLSFSLISGWYIEMFIGLALIIPFLNILIGSLDKKQFRLLLIILILSVGLPSWFNSQPYISRYIYLPNYWKSIYPIIYYLIGAYVKKHGDNINFKYAPVLTFISFTLILLSVYFNQSYKSVGTDGYYSSILEMVLATSIFFIILRKDTREKRLIQFISRQTLATYISAYPVDYIIYPIIIAKLGDPIRSLYYAPLIVVIAFFLSLIFGFVMENLFQLLMKSLSKLKLVDRLFCQLGD